MDISSNSRGIPLSNRYIMIMRVSSSISPQRLPGNEIAEHLCYLSLRSQMRIITVGARKKDGASRGVARGGLLVEKVKVGVPVQEEGGGIPLRELVPPGLQLKLLNRILGASLAHPLVQVVLARMVPDPSSDGTSTRLESSSSKHKARR